MNRQASRREDSFDFSSSDTGQSAVTFWFWATPDTVFACPLAGCAGGPSVLAAQQNIVALRRPLAADDTHVYWSSDKAIVRCPLSGCVGGQPKVVAAGQAEPTSVAVDATHVYWSTATQSRRCGSPSEATRAAAQRPRRPRGREGSEKFSSPLRS